MTIRPANSFWIVFLVLVTGGFIYALAPQQRDTRGQKLLAETRQLLRQQGFKTDLAEFDFSTSPEMQARVRVFRETAELLRSSGSLTHPNYMEMAGTHSALVIWSQPELKAVSRSWWNNGDAMSWKEFREAMEGNQAQVNAAVSAILSGPIAFHLDARAGGAMLLPHLAELKDFTMELGDRMVLAIHDGDTHAAFTDLLAATRLVTAWKIEPVEISHLVRLADTKIVFRATWQALQTNAWPDEQLARLQVEWESANFLTNLSEILAFQCASRIAAYDYDRNETLHPSMPFIEFLRETLPSPLVMWDQFKSQWRRRSYLHGGMYDEEKDVLLYYRDREIERRNAVQASSWMQMRRLPGVMNEILFHSKYNSRIQAIENLHRMGLAAQWPGSSFFGRAAEAEAERRILITAIALERYREKHGAYPETLTSLTPDFLKDPLPDFMNGQPLHYRLSGNGHFLLYSVGLDCVDDGGNVLARGNRVSKLRQFPVPGIEPKEDIVWPLPTPAIDSRGPTQEKPNTLE